MPQTAPAFTVTSWSTPGRSNPNDDLEVCRLVEARTGAARVGVRLSQRDARECMDLEVEIESDDNDHEQIVEPGGFVVGSVEVIEQLGRAMIAAAQRWRAQDFTAPLSPWPEQIQASAAESRDENAAPDDASILAVVQGGPLRAGMPSVSHNPFIKRVERGVYNAPFEGPDGEHVMFSITHDGRRLREALVMKDLEIDAERRKLEEELDREDPVRRFTPRLT